jgi:hypothetical protein
MSGMNTGNMDLLIRSEIWSADLKKTLEDQLMATKYVDWLDGFPDGSTFTIPSIGTIDVNDYLEDTAVQYSGMDTGEFQFQITDYISSATYITQKARQDSFYASKLEANFVPAMSRAIAERVEADILKQGQPGTPNGQTVANLNAINGAAHRWVGGTVDDSKRIIGLEDFARARHALKMANVPDTNLIAIVDPSVEYLLNTLSNLVNVSNNPRWEGIVEGGIGQGMAFVKNVYGFDVYTSNRLALSGTGQTGAVETIGGVASTGASKANLFFSATSDILPWMGAWRQMPKVDAEWNKDFQREEYVTTARYGLKTYRRENLVTVLSDPSIVG